MKRFGSILYFSPDPEPEWEFSVETLRAILLNFPERVLIRYHCWNAIHMPSPQLMLHWALIPKVVSMEILMHTHNYCFNHVNVFHTVCSETVV